MQGSNRRFSTSLNFLDMRIGGGIPVDTVIAMLAPPASQSHLLLRALTTDQPLVYLSTLIRDTDAVESWLAAARQPSAEITAYHTPAETLLEELPTYLDAAPPESFLVIDTINPLESLTRSEYRGLLNDLHDWARDQESVVFLHCLYSTEFGPFHTMTLNGADQVWWLQLHLHSQEIKNKLYITKARGSRALTEPLPLIMTDQILVDTSRNI